MPSQGISSPGRTMSASPAPTAVTLTSSSRSPGKPAGQAGRGFLERAHRLGGATLGVAFERLAAGLHQDDDQAGKWGGEEGGRDDGQHGHDVSGELAAQDAAQVCG